MKFLPGNPGGPGRPKRSTEEKYLRKLTSTVTLQEWREIILTAIAQAKEGDASARRWLSEYLIGKPTPIPETAKEPEDINIIVTYEDDLLPQRPLNIRWVDAEMDRLGDGKKAGG